MADPAANPADPTDADVQLAPVAEARETQPGTGAEQVTDAEQVTNAMPTTPSVDAQVGTGNGTRLIAVSDEQNPLNESSVPSASVVNVMMALLTIMTIIAAFTGDARVASAANLIRGAHIDDVAVAPAGVKRPADTKPSASRQMKRTKRTKEADEVTTHEEANIRKMAESVKCSVCPNVWFSRSSLINKFGLDITEVSNDPAWTCPHCAGECSLCSCVRKRENMVAGQIETRLSGVNYTNDPDIKPPALSYVQWIRRAKAASHASVRAYVAEAWPEMKW